MRFLVVLVATLALTFVLGRSAAADEARILARKGCLACHSTDGTAKVGPSFRGLYGSTRRVESAGAERARSRRPFGR